MKIMKKRIKKNKEIRIALKQLAVLYNRTTENRTFLFPELEEEKVSAS